MKDLTVRIRRFDPACDTEPYIETYTVQVNEGARVLHGDRGPGLVDHVDREALGLEGLLRGLEDEVRHVGHLDRRVRVHLLGRRLGLGGR